MIRAISLIVGLLLAGGCSTATVTAPSSGAATATSVPAPVADPIAITIPKIDAHSSLIPLGLDDSGALAVPPVDQPWQASWYAGYDPAFDGDEVQPGEPGPAIIAGHVDGVIDGRKGQPGIFARLHELDLGDEVLIDRVDGTHARFVVERIERHAKDSFPTEAVYGATDRPELRLITCGGAFDRSAGHYEDNVIVWAVLA